MLHLLLEEIFLPAEKAILGTVNNNLTSYLNEINERVDKQVIPDDYYKKNMEALLSLSNSKLPTEIRKYIGSFFNSENREQLKVLGKSLMVCSQAKRLIK